MPALWGLGCLDTDTHRRTPRALLPVHTRELAARTRVLTVHAPHVRVHAHSLYTDTRVCAPCASGATECPAQLVRTHARAEPPRPRSLAAPAVPEHLTACPRCPSRLRQAPSPWPRGKRCRIWRRATNCIAMATRHRGLISPRIQPGSRLTSEQPQSRLRAGRARRAAEPHMSPAAARSGVLPWDPGTRARPGSVVPGGSPGCRRRPGAPGGAAGGQRSAATALSPPSTPRTASCPQPLREESARHQLLQPPRSPLDPPPQASCPV